MKGMARQVLFVILAAVGIFFLLQTTIQSVIVLGSSMEPSFEEGQRLIVNKVVYRLRDPKLGEVIIFRPPTSNDVDFIKRIIAGPGDTVEIKDGTVYVNDLPLNEPYIKAHPRYTLSPTTVPENEYFVLGDNRNNSNDSHSWGMLPRQNIVGLAWVSIWPPGLIPRYELQSN
jgi:signal peptidase I